MITGPYAKELARDGIKVSEAIPGYVATDPNDGTGHRTPDQAAEIVATSPPSPLLHPREVCWAPSLAPRTGSTSTGGGEDLPHRRPRGPRRNERYWSPTPLRNTWRRWGVSRRNPAVRLGAAADCR
jgi:hypothetical protein